MSTPNETQRRVITLRGDSNPHNVITRFPLNVHYEDRIFSEYNTQIIEDKISRSQLHLDLFNQNLERLGVLQREYESARTHIIRYINLHKSALPPIGRLPREILARIFLECKDTITLLRGDATVWKLCLVSRSWRQLAIALPALWNNISLQNDLPFRRCEFDELHLRMGTSTLELCLSRSTSYPLTLEIYYYDSAVLLGPLLRISDRWENVKISWDQSNTDSDDFEFLLSSIRGQLPKLRRLMLATPDFDFPEVLQLFSDAPKLTHLEFFDIEHGMPGGGWGWAEWTDDYLASKLPWDQITHLTLRVGVPLFAYITFMNLLSRLDTLIAPDIALTDWDDIDNPPANFPLWRPGLRTLLINGNTANYTLPALATPHLSKLCLEVHKGPLKRLELAAQSLSAHFSKYGCPLQTLYIADHLDTAFLNTLFAGTPTVETLYLLPNTCGDLSGFKATFHALTYTFETHNATLLPNLQALYLGHMSSANIGSIIKFICSRNYVAPQIAEQERIPLACVPIHTLNLLNEVRKYEDPEGARDDVNIMEKSPEAYRVYYPSLLDWESPSSWSRWHCSW